MPIQSLSVNLMLFTAKEIGFVVPPRAKVPSEVEGRLASFVDTWKVLTKDTWVLDAIQYLFWEASPTSFLVDFSLEATPILSLSLLYSTITLYDIVLVV